MITGLEQFKYYGEYVKGWAERDKVPAGRKWNLTSVVKIIFDINLSKVRLDLFYKV